MRLSVGKRWLLIALGASLAAGCGREAGEVSVDQEMQSAVEPVRVGSFGFTDGRLFRASDGVLEAVAALPEAGAAGDTLVACATVSPELGAVRFRGLILAPDSSWAAWGTLGPGACVGVIGPLEPPVQVLGRWSGATPESLLWAPAGRYLAIWLRHPGQKRSLAVYDAGAGVRLEMPWEVDCRLVEDCDVGRVAWLGGTLLNVEIRLGPAESSVPFEVNVATAGRSQVPEKEI